MVVKQVIAGLVASVLLCLAVPAVGADQDVGGASNMSSIFLNCPSSMR